MRPLRKPPDEAGPDRHHPALFDLPLGDRLKEQGQHNALSSDPAWEWRRRALSVVADLAATGHTFTADDVIRRVGLPRAGVNQNNAVGALFSLAAKRKWIVKTGDYRPSTRTAARARIIAVWVGNPDTDHRPWLTPPEDPAYPWPFPDPDSTGGPS